MWHKYKPMKKNDFHIEFIDFSLQDHFRAFEHLLNHYMLDKMGVERALEKDMRNIIVSELKKHPTYVGILVKTNKEYTALANCFVNYSTFQAKHLLNIHDFVVHPNFRNLGIGSFLLNAISDYAKQKGYCRLNLEVREDNEHAIRMYEKFGFKSCEPNMYFWEKKL